MGPAWLARMVCLGIVAVVQPAAVPTHETLVVVNSDDASTTPAPISEVPTTNQPPPPIKMTSMEVMSEVSLRYAHTSVVTRVKNPAKKAQEATFRVLLPKSAFISGFVMILNGTSYKAYVKEKDEAKKIYNDAVSHGIAAAHIASKARDSDHFTVSVNVEPQTEAIFNLTYEELLQRRNGIYNHAINLHPGAVVPRMTVKVHIKESQKITQLLVPEVRTGNEVDATVDDAQNAKAIKELTDKEATITFNPDPEEQKRLMQLYALKAKESRDRNEDNRDEGVLGQFVVQYDVARPQEGEILVNDGYFVHFFAPPALPPLPKQVVFVLDTSGSMMDRKIVQLREAMQSILSDLNPADYFSIIEFSSNVLVHDLKEALDDKPPRMNYYHPIGKAVSLVPPYKATPDNIDKAKLIISRLQAEGGTNIEEALSVAINLIRKGVNWTPSATTPSATTPSATTPEPQPTPVALQTGDKDEVITAQAPKKETQEQEVSDTDKPEPMIIFLTDGEATVGETDPKRIISRLSEKNYGPNKATIFSLAFGDDADRSLLRKLSLQNEGFMRHIYEASDSALQLSNFYKQVASPLLAHVKFSYPVDQVKEDSLTKRSFRTFYGGSETIVAGRVEDVPEITAQVSAFCGNDDGVGKKKYSIFPKVPVAKKRDHYLPLERMWAYLTIKQLLDKKDEADDKDDKDKENTPEKKALALALKYEFVTPLTSLVVVKPNATRAVDAESVDKESGPPSYNYAPLAASFASFPSSMLQFPVNGFSLQQSGRRRFRSRTRSKYVKEPLTDGVEQQDGNIRHLKKTGGGVVSHPDALSLDAEPDYEDVQPESDQIVGGYGPPPPMHFSTRSGSPFSAGGSKHSGQWSAFSAGGSKHSYPGQYENFSDENDDDDIDYGGGYKVAPLSTPVFFTTPSYGPPPPPPAAPAAPLSPLVKYHLQKYPWTESLIDATDDKLLLPVNGTNVELKLTSDDINAADESYKNGTCARAAGTSAPGVCVYLTKCDAAQAITVTEYADVYCTVKIGLAGVCCPESSLVGSKTSSEKSAP